MQKLHRYKLSKNRSKKSQIKPSVLINTYGTRHMTSRLIKIQKHITHKQAKFFKSASLASSSIKERHSETATNKNENILINYKLCVQQSASRKRNTPLQEAARPNTKNDRVKNCQPFSSKNCTWKINIQDLPINQHKKQVLLVLGGSRSSSPLRKDRMARCSAAYVMKDASTIPPATINPNLWKKMKESQVSVNIDIECTVGIIPEYHHIIRNDRTLSQQVVSCCYYAFFTYENGCLQRTILNLSKHQPNFTGIQIATLQVGPAFLDNRTPGEGPSYNYFINILLSFG